jgi:hypothetical protein
MVMAVVVTKSVVDKYETYGQPKEIEERRIQGNEVDKRQQRKQKGKVEQIMKQHQEG